ncbi:hypothetical protein ACH3VR_02435 [Microbacterium sp. B2969]|uniref:DUF4190 domain-containing protein n=1 Tax=Microbacterium alkaliflavum TaxID=3248839 RepID=A0ABW7Q3X9_9MICO
MSDPTRPDNSDASNQTPDQPAGTPPTPPADPAPVAPAEPTAPAAAADPTHAPAAPTAPAEPAYAAPAAPHSEGYAAPAGYLGAPQSPYAGTPGQSYGAGQPYGSAQPYGAGQPYGSDQPYGAGQPDASGQPYGAPGAPVPGAPDTRRKTLAIIGLSVAALGLVLSFIPFVTWFSGVFLLAGFVLGLIALINKKQGGKGFAIGAVAISVVGWIVSVVVSIASFGIIGQAAQNALDESRSSEIAGGEASDDEDAAEPAADAEEITVVESAFGRDALTDTWWYVVILDNPNPDHVFDFASVDVEALDASGTILDTANDYVTLLSGQTAVTGNFFDVGQGEIAKLDVRGPEASDAISSPADETGTFTIEGLAATSDDYSTSVSGTVAGTFQDEQELVNIVVVARAADGTIIGGQQTYVDRLPSDGTKVQFEVTFFTPLPADTKYEAYASL